MNANPIGLVITAVGALAAGLTVYKLATDDSKESQYALTEEQKKANEEIHKQYEAYKELDSARKESMESINAEYGYLTQLKDELQGLLDSNGQVIEGYEDRANFIVNQLSEALGIEKEKIWEIIQANGDLGASIDQIIEKKKAEAMLNANEEAYTKAINERDEALKKYTESLATYDTAQKNYNDTQEAANKVMDEYQSLLQLSPILFFSFQLVFDCCFIILCSQNLPSHRLFDIHASQPVPASYHVPQVNVRIGDKRVHLGVIHQFS